MVFEVDIKINRPFGSLAVLFPNRRKEIPELRKKAVRASADVLRDAMKRAVREGGVKGRKPFKPLTRMTVLTRVYKRNTPLYDTGLIEKSIISQVSLNGKKAKVGISAFARTFKFISVAELVALHERGVKPFRLDVTPGMRRFFFKMNEITGGEIRELLPEKTTIMHPGIPARPFIKSSLAVSRRKMKRQADKILRDLMDFKIAQDNLGIVGLE